MQGIRRTNGTAQRRVKALVKDDIIDLVLTAEKQKPLKAAQDVALILWASRALFGDRNW
jgi:hypothetical protein